MKNLLLLSNSSMPGGQFLGWPEPYIKDFLGDSPRNVLFFPFAGVTFSYDEYLANVSARFKAMGHQCTSAHLATDMKEAIESCDAIAVGGGNTFHLLHHLQQGWIDLIHKKVERGTPYIGWSAGSNVTCPTIKTTNDMPIVQPDSFEAINLVDFQINPHFTDAMIPNHGGETRSQRIAEFLEANPDMTVLGVPEGALLEVHGNDVLFKGQGTLRIFSYGKEVVQRSPSDTAPLTW